MKKHNVASSGAFVEEFVISPYKPGNLSNLTFAVKDCIDIKDKVTGFGNPTWANTHPKAIAHAVCVEQLLLSGATCLGKTITDEFTYSLIGENYFYGTPLNPRCPDRVPGGSSSGSASSVACGIVDFALGTDTGGSVRVPASNCGIYGYRPTHGRISVAGVIPLAPSLDTVGVLAKDTSTLKSVASVLLGSNFVLSTTNPKIVVITEALEACEKDIQAAVLQYLEKNFPGFTTVTLSSITSSEINITWLRDLYALIHSCELWSIHGPWVETVRPTLGPIAEYNFNHIAKVANRNLLLDRIKKREWFAQKIREYLKNNIIFCFPTTPEIAPLKGVFSQNPGARTSGTYSERLIGINAIAGLSKSPQITIPIESPSSPIGISFLAGQNQDESLLNLLV